MSAITRHRSRISRADSHSADYRAVAKWAEHVVDLCLVAMLVFAPLFMGGRGPVGQLVFVLLPCIGFIAWILRQALGRTSPWRWSGAELLLLSGAALVIFQLTPLSQSLLAALSPSITELLPLWNGVNAEGVNLGDWSTISLTVEATRGGLTVYVSYVLFFLLLIQRLETVEDIGLLLRLIACSVVLMAMIGLVQFFAGSTKFLGVYEHPSRSACEVVRGTFQNENHFAHFLSLGLGSLIWWLTQRTPRPVALERRHGQLGHKTKSIIPDMSPPILFVSLILVALAGLLTFSRGGVLTFAVALISCVALMRWKALIGRQAALLLSLAVGINLAALMIFGLDSLSSQLATVIPSSSLNDVFKGRTDLWNALTEGISHFYRSGTGVGSHREVYPIFMEEKHDVEFTHGESGYLPLLLETGICGLALMLIGIAATFYWGFSVLKQRSTILTTHSSSEPTNVVLPLVSCACAVIPSLVASVIHSISDFVWYIPACMVMTIAQIACVCRLYQLSCGVAPKAEAVSLSDGARCMLLPRGAWIGLAVLLVVAESSLIWNRVGPAFAARAWDKYLKHSIVDEHAPKPTTTQEFERLAAMENSLKSVLHYNPNDARAHLRIASVYLKKFEIAQLSAENAMDLSQIRDAALASRFPSKKAQDEWLNLVLEDRRQLLDLAQFHSREAVRLSPLQGLAYVQLADLSFLESPRTTAKYAYINQAALVRPHHGQVLFIRGKESALAGDMSTAFKLWRKAFHQDWEIRQLIIESLAQQIPANAFVTTFQPDTLALGQLLDKYRATERLEEAKWVAQLYVNGLQKDITSRSPAEAAEYWEQAQFTYSWLGEFEKALQCQQRAVEIAPHNFDKRRTLAQLLTQHQQYAEAVSHYEWCLRRQPDREDLRNELAEAKVQQLRNPAASVIATNPEHKRRS